MWLLLYIISRNYAGKYIPIIASVSEHQPPTWPSYFMDINVLAFFVPAGIIACFLPLSDASSFVILHIVTSEYFSRVMYALCLGQPFLKPLMFIHGLSSFSRLGRLKFQTKTRVTLLCLAFVSGYAARADSAGKGNLLASLAEAAFLLRVEKNRFKDNFNK